MASASDLNRALRAAQRQAEQQLRRDLKRVEAQAQREVDAYNRKVEAHNRKVVSDYNRTVDQQNRRAVAHNKKVIDDINRRLAAQGQPQVRYTPQEQKLVDRLHSAIPVDGREYDIFLSYAHIDGYDVANELCTRLRGFGLAVWFDEVRIRPGKSLSRQMDDGLRKARAGVALLTPAYLAGRFWTERELGALLHKETLIPVLHGTTIDDVKEYSGILPDLAGFSTATDTVLDIAAKIAGAVLEEVAGSR
ncbi:TIR domain-containing protein [Frankia sp. R82]|uniref:TIR domain-containing protein n=1 Tax=Frankia sp. R82 TaxID=2950553 RepID=UPI002044C3E4|nr:TIR domain-containing protein [Frankia sp. R82]MCM3883100.1 TIR domain-containing protein [Frankia sp. R82]